MTLAISTWAALRLVSAWQSESDKSCRAARWLVAMPQNAREFKVKRL
jgi:hypothetical protein